MIMLALLQRPIDKNFNVIFHYITPSGKFDSVSKIVKLFKENQFNMTNDTIIRWCKKSNKIISDKSYVQNDFLKSLGSKEDVPGKKFKELGFVFLPV